MPPTPPFRDSLRLLGGLLLSFGIVAICALPILNDNAAMNVASRMTSEMRRQETLGEKEVYSLICRTARETRHAMLSPTIPAAMMLFGGLILASTWRRKVSSGEDEKA